MWLSNPPLDRRLRLKCLRIAFLGVFSWLISCGSQSLPEPVLDEVCILTDQPNCASRAHQGSQSTIVIRGRNFYPLYQVNLDNQDKPSTIGEFRAWIGEVEILQLSQEPQKIRGRDSLTGILPAQEYVGLRDALLELPSGQQILLEDAFRIVGY